MFATRAGPAFGLTRCASCKKLILAKIRGEFLLANFAVSLLASPIWQHTKIIKTIRQAPVGRLDHRLRSTT